MQAYEPRVEDFLFQFLFLRTKDLVVSLVDFFQVVRRIRIKYAEIKPSFGFTAGFIAIYENASSSLTWLAYFE